MELDFIYMSQSQKSVQLVQEISNIKSTFFSFPLRLITCEYIQSRNEICIIRKFSNIFWHIWSSFLALSFTQMKLQPLFWWYTCWWDRLLLQILLQKFVAQGSITYFCSPNILFLYSIWFLIYNFPFVYFLLFP